MTGLSSAADLHGHLDCWVAEGLIDAAQAARIEAAEAARAGQPPAGVTLASEPMPSLPEQLQPPPVSGKARARPVPRVPLVAEALGYVGGVLALAAGFLVVRELWPGIPAGAELAFAAVACVALGAAGAALRTTTAPASRRLHSVLWLMSTASLSAFTGVLADRVWQLSSVDTALVTAATATAYAAALWLRTQAVLQHLAVFASAAVLIGTAVTRLGPGLGSWGPGLGVWALSALWAVAVLRGYLRPRATGYLAAGIGLLIGAEMTMQVAAGHVLAIATVAGLLAAGVSLRRAWLVVLGAVGVLIMVPQTATRFLPTSAAAPLAIFVVGLVLLGSAVWLAKRRGHGADGATAGS